MALLTTTIEYISLRIATNKVLWLQGLLDFLGVVQQTPIIIYQNNQSTIALVGSGKTSQRTKHIEVHFYSTKNKIVDGTIQMEYYQIDKIIVDGLTKAIALELFALLQDRIMKPKNIANPLGESVCAAMRR